MLNLVIVESPAKAKTIKQFLGDNFEVMSSYGHIRDLPLKSLGINIEKNFEPLYEVSSDKKNIVKNLNSYVQKADFIYLASDDDREGEAIAWHIKETFKIPDEKIKRIVFHEITKNAIQNAVKKPRNIDIALVHSQQARRILDRLVGYKLSPILWKKIRTGLSAGRVQSVAVRLIVEKEKEIQNFISTSSYHLTAIFLTDKNAKILCELKHNIKDQISAEKFLNELKNTSTFYVANIEKKEIERVPQAPFTTSTLQQEASISLGFSVSQTMLLAQHLYEAGMISYMRTDSVILSEDAIEQANKVIKTLFGERYSEKRQYQNKSDFSQEAHEAIRPTHFEKETAGKDINEQKLYTLIRNRALASQMSNAIVNKTIITIKATKENENDENSVYKENFIAKGEIITFDGFLKIYNYKNNEKENDIILPNVKINDILSLHSALIKETFTQGPGRYNEASLVKELESKGIGRPSTYATIITTIQKRGYVIKDSIKAKDVKINVLTLQNNSIKIKEEVKKIGGEKNKLLPTNIAFTVNDFCVKNFTDITNYDFTANIEYQLDEIAEKKINWVAMLKHFYATFSKELDKCNNNDKIEIQIYRRLLGTDKYTGENIYATNTKYGDAIQVENINDVNAKKIYISLLPGQHANTITLEEALFLKRLPKDLGQYENENITLRNGIYGPYITWQKTNFKIYDTNNIYNFTLEDAINIIKTKQQK